ncbi:MAG TPA: VOC family protein [Thermoleophilaceae bacterium]|nr:VOC family protein [Thermoleophilaceae bacterium]
MATTLGYCVIHVKDVSASLDFYERAFGLRRRMVDGALYAEMETGHTLLAFSERRFAAKHSGPTMDLDREAPPPGLEIVLVTDDVATLHQRALQAGATHVRDPETKPWGQTASYLRDPDGYLVQLCSPATS